MRFRRLSAEVLALESIVLIYPLGVAGFKEDSKVNRSDLSHGRTATDPVCGMMVDLNAGKPTYEYFCRKRVR